MGLGAPGQSSRVQGFGYPCPTLVILTQKITKSSSGLHRLPRHEVHCMPLASGTTRKEKADNSVPVATLQSTSDVPAAEGLQAHNIAYLIIVNPKSRNNPIIWCSSKQGVPHVNPTYLQLSYTPVLPITRTLRASKTPFCCASAYDLMIPPSHLLHSEQLKKPSKKTTSVAKLRMEDCCY